LLVSFNWATAQLGNRRLRMNGRHSSTMLAQLNGSFPNGLSVHLDDYAVDDENGLALLFRQFDDRKSGRTPIDVSGAYQGLYETLRDVNKKTAQLGVKGVAWFQRNIEGSPVPPGDDIYTLFGVTGLHGFLRWLGAIFDIKTPELRLEAVVAAMYATYIASEHGANEFWSSVARGGIEYDDTAAATVLDLWLKNLKAKEPDTSQIIGKMKPANYYQGCIYAWNAYRQNQALKQIDYNTKKGFKKVIN
jgi:hypothetical protein